MEAFKCLVKIFHVETDRETYVKDRLNAIKAVQPHVFDKTYLSSKTNALRGIKRFEAINGIAFDYKKISHICIVAGAGSDEHLFRELNRIFKKYEPTAKTTKIP
jgi:hypothetical protein